MRLGDITKGGSIVAGCLLLGVSAFFGSRFVSNALRPSGEKAALYIDESALDGKGLDLTRALPSLRLRVGVPTLLVAMGGCDACTRRTFDPRKVPENYQQIVLLYSSSDTKLPPGLGARFVAALDPDGSIHQALNADFPPRQYHVDSTLHVVAAEVGGIRQGT